MSKRCLIRCKKPHMKILITEKVIARRLPGTPISKSSERGIPTTTRRRPDDDPTRHFVLSQKPLCERTIAARSINPTAFDHKSIGACTHAAEIIIILKMTSQSIDYVRMSVFRPSDGRNHLQIKPQQLKAQTHRCSVINRQERVPRLVKKFKSCLW